MNKMNLKNKIRVDIVRHFMYWITSILCIIDGIIITITFGFIDPEWSLNYGKRTIHYQAKWSERWKK